MEIIPSFTINHFNLLPGIYVSRYDYVNKEVLTTFDLRFVRPNIDQVIDTGTIHTIEHLGATFLRNYHNWKDKIIYFGPMGCRTGCYLIIHGKYQAIDILDVIKEMLKYIIDFNGDIPGATARDCGNYLDHNLEGAKVISKKYLQLLDNIKEENLVYPK